MNLHRCSLQHVQGDFVSFPKRSRQGAVRMTRREPAGLSVWREGCEMMADFLLKDMDIYIYIHIFFHINIIHIQYISYILIYIYTFFLYICNFERNFASSRSSYEAPVSQVEALQRRGGKSQTTGKLIWQIEEWHPDGVWCISCFERSFLKHGICF